MFVIKVSTIAPSRPFSQNHLMPKHAAAALLLLYFFLSFCYRFEAL